MIASGVPLAMVSKTLRHSTLTTTVDIYGRLARQAAQDAVDATACPTVTCWSPARPRRRAARPRPARRRCPVASGASICRAARARRSRPCCRRTARLPGPGRWASRSPRPAPVSPSPRSPTAPAGAGGAAAATEGRAAAPRRSERLRQTPSATRSDNRSTDFT
jgi:hypothetical protein